MNDMNVTLIEKRCKKRCKKRWMSAIIFAVLLAGGKAGAGRDSDSSQRRAAEGREETRNDTVRYSNKIHFESFRYCT